jgi:hypothetical protein
MAKQILETQRSLLRTPAVPEQAELREAGKEPEGIA